MGPGLYDQTLTQRTLSPALSRRERGTWTHGPNPNTTHPLPGPLPEGEGALNFTTKPNTTHPLPGPLPEGEGDMNYARPSKTIQPSAAQARWYKFWESKNYFHSEPDPAKRPYCIVIPPPNVTGACTWATP